MEKRIGAIATIAILPPSVDVYEIDLTGTPKRVDAWSDTAREKVWAAAATEMKKLKRVLVTTLSPNSLSESQRTDITESQLVFEAVNASLLWLTSSAHVPQFAEKLRNFDYSVGNFAEIGARADALLMIRGFDQVSSTGRKVTNLIMVSAMAGAAASRMVLIPSLSLGQSSLSVALVDARTGEILWYRRVFSAAGLTDLRDPESAASLMRRALKEFPISD